MGMDVVMLPFMLDLASAPAEGLEPVGATFFVGQNVGQGHTMAGSIRPGSDSSDPASDLRESPPGSTSLDRAGRAESGF